MTTNVAKGSEWFSSWTTRAHFFLTSSPKADVLVAVSSTAVGHWLVLGADIQARNTAIQNLFSKLIVQSSYLQFLAKKYWRSRDETEALICGCVLVLPHVSSMAGMFFSAHMSTYWLDSLFSPLDVWRFCLIFPSWTGRARRHFVRWRYYCHRPGHGLALGWKRDEKQGGVK